MEERNAVYAGVFDPFTLGHLWMVEEGAALFDTLIVAVGVNPEKRCAFSLDDRLEMLRRTLGGVPNVEVRSFANQYLMVYAKSIGARYVLRGIRTESDYEYERVMKHVNDDLKSGVTTVFLIPPREISEVSSSMFKGLIGPAGWEAVVRRYLPMSVFDKIKEMRDAEFK